MLRPHRLAERFLADVLGMDWVQAHEEAHHLERGMSPAIEKGLMALLGNPNTCPHGNPIPGRKYVAPETRPLAALAVGDGFTVSRIPEELEFTPGLLEFLEEADLRPGMQGRITAASPDGTTTVEIEGHHVGIGAFAAARILVTSG